MSDRSRLIILPVILIVLAVLVGGLWWTGRRTYHFASVEKGVLYRSGNRGLGEFEHAIARGGIKTVIPLIDDAELSDPAKPQFQREMAWCQSHGVQVIRIPIQLGGWPTSEDVRKFLSAVSDKQNQPVLVHCAQGVRRTGFMVAAFEKGVLGWNDDQCERAMLTFGHSRRTVGDVQRFIEGYDPNTGAVPVGLPMGKE